MRNGALAWVFLSLAAGCAGTGPVDGDEFVDEFGGHYVLEVVNETQDEPEREATSRPARDARQPAMALRLAAATPVAVEDEVFRDGSPGGVREEAKTSIASAPIEDVSLSQRNTWLTPADAAMNALVPGVGENTPRVTQEQRNVRFSGVLLAIKHVGDDNDYHLVVASSANAGPSKRLTCEIAALPIRDDAATKTKLRAVRKQLTDYFKDKTPKGSWVKPHPPIPIEITGSLYFDLHAAGSVGPQGLRPDTAWEVHPVTKVRLGGTP